MSSLATTRCGSTGDELAVDGTGTMPNRKFESNDSCSRVELLTWWRREHCDGSLAQRVNDRLRKRAAANRRQRENRLLGYAQHRVS